MVNGIGFDELLTFLRDSPFFSSFDPVDLAPLLDTVQVREVRTGETVFEQGQDADAFYVVYRGSVAIDRSWQDGSPRRLGSCGPHDCFGEQAIIEAAPRLAGATTSEDTVLLRFPRSKFEKLVSSGNPTAVKLVLQMARTTSRRLRRQVELLERVRVNLVEVLDDSSDV